MIFALTAAILPVAAPAIAQEGLRFARNGIEVNQYELACKGNNPWHCLRAADAYYDGIVVEKDWIKADILYARACAAKIPIACTYKERTAQYRQALKTAPEARKWGPEDPIPDNRLPFAVHVAAMRGIGAIALNEGECRYLRQVETVWTGSDLNRWNALRKTWWQQPEGSRYGRICDTVPPKLAEAVREDLRNLALQATQKSKPAPQTFVEALEERNREATAQEAARRGKKQSCYVQDGRTICSYN